MSGIQVTPPKVSLNTDFGHAPLGKLGNRSVSIGQVTSPRTTPASTNVKSLWSRFLNAISPQNSRVESKFRQNLSQFSNDLSNCLGKIASGENKQKVGDALLKLVDSSSSLTKQGAKFSDIMDSQLQLKLSQMTPDELAALHMKLVESESMKFDPGSTEAKLLKSLLDTVTKTQNARAQEIEDKSKGRVEKELLPLIKNLAEKSVDSEGKLLKKSSEGYATAFDFLLQAAGKIAKAIAPETHSHSLEMGLVKEALLLMQSQAPDGLANLMKHIPSSYLLELSKGDLVHSSSDTMAKMDNLIKDEIKNRGDEINKNLGKALDSILERSSSLDDEKSPILDPIRFARDIIEMDRNMKAAKDHAKLFGGQVDSNLDDKFKKALLHLDTLVQDDNLNLTDLNTETLGALRKTLGELGLKGADKALEAEGNIRVETAKENCEKTFQSVFDSIKSGDLESLFVHLNQLTRDSDAVLHALEANGGKYKGADDFMELRGDWIAGMLSKLEPSELKELYAKLDSKSMQILGDVLGSAGSGIMSRSGTTPFMMAKGKEMFNACTNLVLFRSMIAETLEEKGEKLPPSPDIGRVSPKDLDIGQVEAIRKVWGISIEPNGFSRFTKGELSPSFQNSFEKGLQTRLESESKMMVINGRPIGVTEQFWLDFHRSNHSIETDKGIVPLLDHKGPSEGLDIQKNHGIGMLKKFLGDDPEMLAFISGYVHQSMLGPIEGHLLKEEGPVKLPDGTRGQLTGKHSLNFTYSKDKDGNIKVKCDYEIPVMRNFTAFSDKGAEMVQLDPRTSYARYSTELTFTPDKEVFVSQPVEIDYRVDVDSTWNSPDFGRPKDLNDILDSSVFKFGEESIQTAFGNYAKERFVKEGFDFLMAYKGIDEHFTYDQFKDLVDRFIIPGGEQEINIGSEDVKAIQQAMIGLNQGNFTPEAARTILRGAFDSMHTTFTNDVLKGFVKKYEKQA